MRKSDESICSGANYHSSFFQFVHLLINVILFIQLEIIGKSIGNEEAGTSHCPSVLEDMIADTLVAMFHVNGSFY